VNGFDRDLVRRSLAMAGEEADEEGTARRKARFKASIAELETDPGARARIDGIAASVGIADQADHAAPGASENMPPQNLSDGLDPAGSVIRSWKRMLRRLRRAPGQRKTATRAGGHLPLLGWDKAIMASARRDRERLTQRTNRELHLTPEKRGRATRLGDYLARLGGGDPAILAQVWEERPRFIQMAGVLLTTSVIAVISMIFAMHDAVGAPLPAAVALGLLWGAVIFCLDRFLVFSMGRTRGRWRMIWVTIPRLALAVVLAVVISTPLVLRIFASDINAELATLRQEKAVALVESSPQARQAAQVQEQIRADQAVLDGHLPESITSPQLQSAQARVNTLQAQTQRAQQAVSSALEKWQCQLNGLTCNGVPAVAGNGQIAQADHQQYQLAVKTYNSLQNQLAAAQAALSQAQNKLTQTQSARLTQLQTEARASLHRLQAQYQAIESQIQKASANASAVSAADTGILAQLQALSAVSAKSPSLEAASLTVLVLFLLIGFLPVSVKFLLNLGPPTAYEIVAQLQEEQLTQLARLRYAEELRIEKARSQARIDVENEIPNRERNLGIPRSGYIRTSVGPATVPAAITAGRSGQHVQLLSGQNCTVFLTDVVAFGSRSRTNEDRRIIREALFSMMHAALRDLPDVWSWDDRGDGLLTVVPPNVPTAKVMDGLLSQLPAELELHNGTQRESAQFQLRLAVDVGPVVSETMGVSGEAITAAARLVEAPDFKKAIAQSTASLGVIASPFVYETVIRHVRSASDVAGYYQVKVKVKESSLTAWMKLFDSPGPSPLTDVIHGGDDLQINFWNSLSTEQQKAFRSMATRRIFALGARLMQEGEQADHVAVILGGWTEIRIHETGGERVVARRGPGQLIGERAALQVNVRSATVVAIQTVDALVMRTEDFAAFISTYPSALGIVEKQIYTRLREGTVGEVASSGPEQPLPSAGREDLAAAVATVEAESAEPLLTPAEVATMFRVDPKTVTRWAKAGKLTSIRTLTGHRRYRETEVRALLAGIPQQKSE
jgi:CRP-like cAMP-binding protein